RQIVRSRPPSVHWLLPIGHARLESIPRSYPDSAGKPGPDPGASGGAGRGGRAWCGGSRNRTGRENSMMRLPQAELAGMVAAGTALKEHASEIVQLWVSRAVVDPRLPGSHRTDLRNSLPQLLFRMGNDLAEGRGRQSISTER